MSKERVCPLYTCVKKADMGPFYAMKMVDIVLVYKKTKQKSRQRIGLHEEKKVGIGSIYTTAKKLDRGPLYAMKKVDICPIYTRNKK